jgi:rRNA small subunit pseudouridine methyltransferase Nep1
MRSSPDSPRFVFILAESELETVPKDILNDRCVLSNARTREKKPSNILLDASFHHAAMNKLDEGERRGRPDIVHFFLMLCLDSRLNHAGRLRTVVHTRNDERIAISPETRLPPSYHRFVGLMESLFQNGAVPSREKPLMKMETGWSLIDVIKAEKCERVIVLEAGDVTATPAEAIWSKPAESIAVVIGGFPSGSLHADLSQLEPEKLSLGEEMLKVWTVTSEMLVAAYPPVREP